MNVNMPIRSEENSALLDAPSSYLARAFPIKRVFDVVLTIIALPVVLLLGGIIALVVASDGNNPIYRQRRVGRFGTEFSCLKFRTMVVGAEDDLHTILREDAVARAEWLETRKLKNDPRVTRVGRFLRKTSLDELPQILNVLRGEMSLVGPRPILHDELSRYGNAEGVYLACAPGLTGLWQISGRNDISYASRVALDVEYFLTWSPLLDLKVILLTIPALLTRDGAY